MRLRNRTAGKDRGFTLIELAVAMVVFAVIGVAIYGVMIRTSQSEAMGSSISEAQQNARAALDVILRDMRESGYGTGQLNAVPIEIASEFRVTFVADRNLDGIIGPGERRTYFLDNDASDPIVAGTPNPDDYVLRRVTSTPLDLGAVPATGKGQVVAYGVTQRTEGSSTWDIRLFDYLRADGTSLIGGLSDPAGSQWGNTVPDSLLGKPAGSGLVNQINTIRVDVVAEASHRDPETHDFRQVRVSGTIHPRNFGLVSHKLFDAAPPVGTGTGTGTGMDTTGTGMDTTGTGLDSTQVELPPEEPPIRIPTERVLSLALADLHEKDSWENSNVTSDHQHDLDIMVGTQSGGTNNLAVWFEAYPDLYPSERLYQAYPNYTGYSAYDINSIAIGNLDASASNYVDAVTASATSDTEGGFEVWLNQDVLGLEGHLGTGSPTSLPNGYYTQSSGAGRAIALGDFNEDGRLDVALGTRTGANSGRVEIWVNAGLGVFKQIKVFSVSGEVNALVVADFNRDGAADFAVGTKTSNNNIDGKLEVWLNKIRTQVETDFTRLGTWDAGGQVKTMAVGYMNADSRLDLVLGTQTGARRGQVELWLNKEASFLFADKVAADDVVLSVAIGDIDYGNTDPDIAIGTAARSVQAWFCDQDAALESDIIPENESWGDANAGGLVNAIAIGRVQASQDDPYKDVLNDIVVGTAVSATTGEIVIYLNPYIWTLNTGTP